MATKEITEKEVKAKAKKEIKKIDIDKDKIMQEIKNDLTIKLKGQVTKELIDDIKKDEWMQDIINAEPEQLSILRDQMISEINLKSS